MGGAGARANIAALDDAMAAELAQNNVDGPGENPVNADQPPGPFDNLLKMDYKTPCQKTGYPVQNKQNCHATEKSRTKGSIGRIPKSKN